MELSSEMDSNLNAAHFHERRAVEAYRLGNVNDAIDHYQKSIEFMESVRDELEEEDIDFQIFDLQLTQLKYRLTMIQSLGIHSADVDNIIPVAVLPGINTIGTSSANPSITKLPKSESQLREEMITCIRELRRLVDVLAEQVQVLNRRWCEERDRRQMIEAELLATQPYPDTPGYRCDINPFPFPNNAIQPQDNQTESPTDSPQLSPSFIFLDAPE